MPTTYLLHTESQRKFLINCLQCTYVQHRTRETNCSKQELLPCSVTTNSSKIREKHWCTPKQTKSSNKMQQETGAHQSFMILLACPAAAVDGADKDLKQPIKTFATSTSLRQQTMSILGMKQTSKHPTSLLHQSFHCPRRSMEVQRQSMWPTRLRQTNHEHSEHETNKQTIPHQFTRASLL